MKAFIGVSLFFVLFSVVVGGSLFLSILAVGALHLPDDAEKTAMVLTAMFALISSGLLMRHVHAMIERRL